MKSLPEILRRRESGCYTPELFHDLLLSNGSQKYELIAKTETTSPLLSVDSCVRERYLLTGDSKGSIRIYDLELSVGQGLTAQSLRLVREHGRSPISTKPVVLRWHRKDTGMFFTAQETGTVAIWDTNLMENVISCKPYEFDSRRKALSGLEASEHATSSLAVVSFAAPAVKLLDVRSGTASHVFNGHSDGVSSVAWMPHTSYVLASGGLDSRILFWDTRKSGFQARLASLDSCSPVLFRKQASRQYSVLPSVLSQTSRAHTAGCFSIKFDATGRWLVSLGGRGELRAWEIQNDTVGTSEASYVSPLGTKPVEELSGKHVPLEVTTRIGSHSAASIWSRRGTCVQEHSLGRGGRPQQLLQSHLGKINCIHALGSSGKIVTTANDRLLLFWGASRLHRGGAVYDADDW